MFRLVSEPEVVLEKLKQILDDEDGEVVAGGIGSAGNAGGRMNAG
jgi:hypothetical protein